MSFFLLCVLRSRPILTEELFFETSVPTHVQASLGHVAGFSLIPGHVSEGRLRAVSKHEGSMVIKGNLRGERLYVTHLRKFQYLK